MPSFLLCCVDLTDANFYKVVNIIDIVCLIFSLLGAISRVINPVDKNNGVAELIITLLWLSLISYAYHVFLQTGNHKLQIHKIYAIISAVVASILSLGLIVVFVIIILCIIEKPATIIFLLVYLISLPFILLRINWNYQLLAITGVTRRSERPANNLQFGRNMNEDYMNMA